MKKGTVEGRYIRIGQEWYILEGNKLVPAEASPELNKNKNKSPSRYTISDGVELAQGEFEQLLEVGVLLETPEKNKYLWVSEERGELGIVWLSKLFGEAEKVIFLNIEDLQEVKLNAGNTALLKAIKILYGVNYIKDGFWHHEVLEFHGVWWKLGYKFNGNMIYTSVRRLEMEEKVEQKNKWVKDIEL